MYVCLKLNLDIPNIIEYKKIYIIYSIMLDNYSQDIINKYLSNVNDINFLELQNLYDLFKI